MLISYKGAMYVFLVGYSGNAWIGYGIDWGNISTGSGEQENWIGCRSGKSDVFRVDLYIMNRRVACAHGKSCRKIRVYFEFN